jgi:hypothetical protein
METHNILESSRERITPTVLQSGTARSSRSLKETTLTGCEVERPKSKLYSVLVARQVLAWQGSDSVFDV